MQNWREIVWSPKSNKKRFSVKDACALTYVDFSLPQYQQMRLYFKNSGINMPIRNDLDNYKKTLMITWGHKDICEFKLLVLDTVKSLTELNS